MKKLLTVFCLGFSIISDVEAAKPVAAAGGMVVTEQRLASAVGADILKAGGNAIDAAVAVGYALAVVDSCCGNIGGGGFMLIHFANGKDIFLNFREKAPQKAYAAMFSQAPANASLKGYLAVAVPGTVLGLDTALQKYGTLPRATVMAPAIKLAREGYIMTRYQAEHYRNFASIFRQQPNTAAIFLKHNEPLKAGDRLIQTDLANTLTLIAKKGPEVFYKGPVAKSIVNASFLHGGILTLKDFAAYQVAEYPPIRCLYRGMSVISAPPPSSGGVTLCEMLSILNYFPLKTFGPYSSSSVRYITEAMRYGFADRNRYLGDPDFVQNPIEKLLSNSYIKSISEKIRHQLLPVKSNNLYPIPELTDTTHYSVIDKMGNVVAVTYTLNGFFGAGVIAGDTGFFLNNEMDDFMTIIGSLNKFGLVQSANNAVAGGKRPLSSMTPTIVLRKGHIYMVLGSSGGPRIITAVMLTILNVVDYDMNIQNAINAPRFHYQGQPDVINIEPNGLSALTIRRLEKMGYHVLPQPTWAAVEAILANGNMLYGASDPRRPDGAAIGIP